MRKSIATVLFAVSAVGSFPAAAQIASLDHSAAPMANQPETWLKTDDFLTFVDQKSDAVRLILAINEQGRAYRCEIVHSSGISALDQSVCSLMTRRSQFRPARDRDSRAVPSEWSQGVTAWLKPEQAAADPRSGFDIILGVNKLPGGKPFLDVVLREMIDVSGKIESCAVDQPSGAAALDTRACQMVAGQQAVKPLKDVSGKPVRGMRVLRVGFLTDAALAGTPSAPAPSAQPGR